MKQSKKKTRVIWCANIGLHMKCTYSYIWIYHMSSWNTLKGIAVSSILTAKDICDTIYVIVDYRVGIFPFLISAMLLTRRCSMVLRRDVFNLHPLIDRSAEHDMLKLTLINARLEIPHVNYVGQCNTVPNENTIANMYMYRDMSPFKNNQKLITC